MLPLLTTAGMQEADRWTIESFGIPAFTLMESAGRGAVAAMRRHFRLEDLRRVLVLCGKGNNGGDGFVVARILLHYPGEVHVLALGTEDAISEDAARNLSLLRKLNQEQDAPRLHLHYYEDLAALKALPEPDLIVDALLGTGVKRDLQDPIRGIVDWVNQRGKPVVAMDVPTGLDSDTGIPKGLAVKANLTTTMAALKLGLCLNEGPAHTGSVEVIEIGIPQFLLKRLAVNGAFLPEDDDIRGWLPERPYDAHKYSTGLVLAAAGARGLSGAPVMASEAASRIGAGAVVCACPQSVQPLLAGKMTEVMTLGLPETEEGTIGSRALHEPEFQQRLRQAKSLLVGCGLGKHPETHYFVRALLAQSSLPAVVDADGLNAFEGHTELFSTQANGRWILTPHAGEFGRLAGSDVDLTDRCGVVRAFAREWNCVVLLKGMPAVVGCPDGTVYVNRTGNPALASAGTGDILAGFCAGLLAQGCSPVQAAVAALHVGGAAADRYVLRHDARCMVATDLLHQVTKVMKDRFSRGRL